MFSSPTYSLFTPASRSSGAFKMFRGLGQSVVSQKCRAAGMDVTNLQVLHGDKDLGSGVWGDDNLKLRKPPHQS